jgi:hypothetical protein
MPPVEPLAATKHTQAGASAFAKFFILTIDWGYATVDSSYLSQYADRTCASCQSLIEAFRSDRREGHTYVGGRTTVVRVDSRAVRSQIVVVNTTSFEELNKRGHFVSGDGAYHDLRFDVHLRWAMNGWRVAELQVVQ